MLITKTAKVKWGSINKTWYKSKGYKFTKIGDEFEVKVEDLTEGNDYPIEYFCDYCLENGKKTICHSTWKRYIKKKSNKDNCTKCINKKQKEMGVVHKKDLPKKEDVIMQYINLKTRIGKIPSQNDIQAERIKNSEFFTISDVEKLFGGMIGLKETLKYGTFNKYDKECLKIILQEYCKNNNPILTRRAFNKTKGIPDYQSFFEQFNCDDLFELYSLCEIKLSKEEEYTLKKDNFSKEETINIIKIMQSKLNRPLMYDDFRNPRYMEVGFTLIKKYWGTVNKMKKELGLEIIQEDMCSKHKTLEEAKKDLLNICNIIYIKENRKIITSKDIKKYSNVQLASYHRIFKDNNLSLREFILGYGFELQKEGNGLNYTYSNGERIRSQYELDFSNFLREKLGMLYNKDYFRDVRYKEFISDYNNYMDCDYIIHINNKIVYIEIAGMLKNAIKENEDWHNTVLKSKSKEKYRQKLLEKEKMLKENNLQYYILFPSDLREDFLLQLFDNIKNN